MRTAVLALAVALAACGAEQEQPAPQPTETAPAASPSPDERPVLEELTAADLEGLELGGELGCSFRRDADAQPIWFGSGDVMPDAGAQAAIKMGGTVRKLAMVGKGGYDAMADGARFEDGGVALAIAKSSDTPLEEEPQVAMESPRYPATMTFATTGEEERTIQGLFECGP